MWRNTGVGGAWTRAGTLIIARAHRARLMKFTIAFADSMWTTHAAARTRVLRSGVIPERTQWRSSGRKAEVGRRCLLGWCRSRVASHAEDGGGNLYSGIPMAPSFRHQGKLALVAGHRSFAVDDDTGREDTRLSLSGMGWDRIGSDLSLVLSGPDRVSDRTQPSHPRWYPKLTVSGSVIERRLLCTSTIAWRGIVHLTRIDTPSRWHRTHINDS